jgi:hypothetical protein
MGMLLDESPPFHPALYRLLVSKADSLETIISHFFFFIFQMFSYPAFRRIWCTIAAYCWKRNRVGWKHRLMILGLLAECSTFFTAFSKE